MNTAIVPSGASTGNLAVESGKTSPPSCNASALQALNLLAGNTTPSPSFPREKSTDLTPAVKGGLLELQNKLSDLTNVAQECFDEALDQQIRTISGFSGVLSFHNLRFQSEGGLTETAREEWRLLKEKENKELKECRATYLIFKRILTERIKILQSATHNHLIETAVLRAITTGHPNNSSGVQWYGIPFRFGELKEALDARKLRLQIHAPEATPVDIPAEPAPDSLKGKLLGLCHRFACLKEEASVIYECLKMISSEGMKVTESPQKFYSYLMNQLKESKKSATELKKSIEDQLEVINAEEKGTTIGRRLEFLSQERSEFVHCLKKILEHEKETAGILVKLQMMFSLVEEGDKSASPHFGEVYTQAFHLLNLIVTQRERVFHGNAFELGVTDLRKTVYFKELSDFEDYQGQKKKFDQDKVAPRLQMLANAIQIYQGSVKTFEMGMRTVENQLKVLESETKARVKWQLDSGTSPSPTSSPSPSLSPSPSQSPLSHSPTLTPVLTLSKIG